MLRLGIHVSISGTIDKATDRAKELDCNTFQMFTRNPRGWKYKKLVDEEVVEFKRKGKDYGLHPPVAHMPYLPNLSCPMKSLYNKSVKSLVAELGRCETLGVPYLVTHLGSHLGKGSHVGLDRLTSAINTALSENHGQTIILLENMAGTKNSMGSTFEEIRRIVNKVENKERVGLCLDTAHAYAAGYDIRSAEGIKETLAKLDSVLGLTMLKVVHVNDSQVGLGSGRDRHEHIGMGYIGEKGFRTLFKQEAIRSLPLLLETPIDNRRDAAGNMRKVRELYG